MDSYEATRVVFSRIQSLDPDNASKIMGLLLIQDHGEKEMIRLAFGPETLLHSLVVKARKELCLPSSTSPATTPSTPSSPSPFLQRQSSSSLASSWVNSSASPVSSPASASVSSLSQLPKGCDDLGNNGFLPMQGGSPSPSSFFGGGDALVERLQLPDQLSFLNDDANTSPEVLSSPTDSYCE